jgi:hypothetical protein
MPELAETRRRFMTYFAGVGLGSTLAPGIVWARMQDAGTQTITLEMITDALKLSGIELTEDERKEMVAGANRNLTQYADIRKIHIPNDVSPPFHFSPIVPGMEVSKARLPFRLSAAPSVKRPANLEDVAFWPIRSLGELVRTRQVTSLELTEMYLARLHRYNGKLNNVVSFLDDYGRAEARKADAEIAGGKYKGPLHGIPLGRERHHFSQRLQDDVGSPAFKEQTFDYDASVVEMLRDAGAVLIAKLATGELASGDQRGSADAPAIRGIRRRARADRRPGLRRNRRGLRRVRHRHRNQWLDSQSGGTLRTRWAAPDFRPDQPLRRDGAVVDTRSAWTDLPLRRGLRHRHAGGCEARWSRHERVGRSVQLECAVRRQEAEGRLHQGFVRHVDQCRSEGQYRQGG